MIVITSIFVLDLGLIGDVRTTSNPFLRKWGEFIVVEGGLSLRPDIFLSPIMPESDGLANFCSIFEK